MESEELWVIQDEMSNTESDTQLGISEKTTLFRFVFI